MGTTVTAGEVPPAAPVATSHSSPTGTRRIAQAALFAIPLVWIALAGWSHRFITEDGFIYLRIVRQLREGNGPVFNPGERVEAYTGTLWVGVLAVADLLTPVRLEWLSVLVGLACTVAGVCFALAGARRLWAGTAGDALLVPLGAVVFVALFPVWAYATSGLETGLVFAWLGACLWILAGWASDHERGVSALEAAVLGLGWLVRPEMVLFSAAFVLLVVAGGWSTATGRRRALLAGAALAAPVAYQVFRMGYFGSLAANTAIVKEGTGGNLDRGWAYLSDFAGPYWLWVPIAGLVVAGYAPLAARAAGSVARRRRIVAATFVSGALLNTLYVVFVGGDYHHGRMFLPALFAICAPVAAVPATRRHLAGLAVGAWAVLAVVFLRPDQHEDGNWLANGFLAPQEFGVVTRDDHGWGDTGAALGWYTGPAYYLEAGPGLYRQADVALRDDLQPPFGAFWGVGISAYSAGPDFHVFDQLGLAETFTAHLEGRPSLNPGLPRFPGHEKPIPTPWLAALVTPPGAAIDPADFPPFPGNPLIPPVAGDEFHEQVAWARAALECDEIAELLESARAPLTFGRFAENLVTAPARTRLRIPPEPEAAYRRFCGSGTPPGVVDASG